ncbi:hypothetical protein O6H91_17G087200 [Diphasiastrum complanatum]|uniref:Uncharacterized protein n=1 Tax=Diphasiastrum complanatum TaxID=34168 RepID=A0ACC2B8R3_DIPCM|nr:hypothetical protein O6H91_17G087200 [Diphasiastrum complanatum]
MKQTRASTNAASIKRASSIPYPAIVIGSAASIKGIPGSSIKQRRREQARPSPFWEETVTEASRNPRVGRRPGKRLTRCPSDCSTGAEHQARQPSDQITKAKRGHAHRPISP